MCGQHESARQLSRPDVISFKTTSLAAVDLVHHCLTLLRYVDNSPNFRSMHLLAGKLLQRFAHRVLLVGPKHLQHSDLLGISLRKYNRTKLESATQRKSVGDDTDFITTRK